jgi:hypothetical protein
MDEQRGREKKWGWFSRPTDKLTGTEETQLWPGLKRALIGIAAVTLFVLAIVAIPALVASFL